MIWQYTPFIIPLFIATIISGTLAIYAWRRRRPGSGAATAFALLMLVVAQWSLGYTLELGGADLNTKIFWAKVEYLGIASLPLAWLAFALHYTNRDKWLTRRNLILLAIIPVITVLFSWTNQSHGLIWNKIELDTSGPFLALNIAYGGWFWVHSFYSYVLLLAGTFLLIKVLRPPQLYRQQTSAILVGTLIPWIGNGLYISGLSPILNLDLTPFAFAISGLIMSWGLFRYKLLDIVPIARRAVVDSMSDGVIVLDTQNRVVDLNPAAQHIVGYTVREAIGKTDVQVLSNLGDLVEHYGQATEVRIEVVLNRDNNWQCFEIDMSALYDRQNHLTGRLIVLRDITERKKAEEALAHARDQALEASNLKSQLLAKVSHELRTPLGTILGYTELLQNSTFGPVSDKQIEITEKVIDSTQYLTILVNELLDQAQLEVGRLRLTISPFNLKEMVSQVETKMSKLAQTKGLALTVNIAAGMPIIISGDENRLQQILVNLVSNAIKFTKTGKVQIHLYCSDADHWTLEVSDTGVGIPREAQSYIFEPFWQVDGSITKEYRGYGLGLSIVKQLTILMGGQIILESEVGQGSTFTITLPLTPIQKAATL